MICNGHVEKWGVLMSIDKFPSAEIPSSKLGKFIELRSESSVQALPLQVMMAAYKKWLKDLYPFQAQHVALQADHNQSMEQTPFCSIEMVCIWFLTLPSESWIQFSSELIGITWKHYGNELDLGWFRRTHLESKRRPPKEGFLGRLKTTESFRGRQNM